MDIRKIFPSLDSSKIEFPALRIPQAGYNIYDNQQDNIYIREIAENLAHLHNNQAAKPRKRANTQSHNSNSDASPICCAPAPENSKNSSDINGNSQGSAHEGYHEGYRDKNYQNYFCEDDGAISQTNKINPANKSNNASSKSASQNNNHLLPNTNRKAELGNNSDNQGAAHSKLSHKAVYKGSHSQIINSEMINSRAAAMGEENNEAEKLSIGNSQHYPSDFRLSKHLLDARTIRKACAKLLKSFQLFDESYAKGDDLSHTEQWIIDNYYIIDTNFETIKRDLTKELAKYLTASFEICTTYLQIYDSKFDIELFQDFIASYQNKRLISIVELWNLPLCLKLALLYNATQIALKSQDWRENRNLAQNIIKLLNQSPASKQQKLLAQHKKYLKSDSFIVNFYYQLQQHFENHQALEWIKSSGGNFEYLAKQLEKQHYQDNITIANIISSIKKIDDIDWEEQLEPLSIVDRYLRQNSEYHKLDSNSRQLVRKQISIWSQKSNLTELELSKNITCQLKEQFNLQYYLFGEGMADIEKSCNITVAARVKIARLLKKYNFASLLTILGAIAFAYSALVAKLSFTSAQSDSVGIAIFCLLFFIAIDLAFAIANKIVAQLYVPHKILSYDFTSHIPPEHSTLVAVPCLLINEQAINELVANLEANYLVSPKGNLFFALISDWADSNNELTSQDSYLLKYAENAIARLNQKYYQKEGSDLKKFYILHRKRQYNAQQGCFMGWERKRGKIEELNLLLRGSCATSFITKDTIIKDAIISSNIQHIIILDSDTKLALSSAAQLIGKMAYNLESYQPYGLLQPRISNQLCCAKEGSFFQDIMSQGAGIDPYIAGISDLYQDLFGAGSYVGKAIYNIDIFNQGTLGKIAENSVLSHDLLEGSLVKTCFVSDVDFLESYPKSYLNDASRKLRWCRGDWQLLPIIYGRGKLALDRLTIFKMIDNIRRSLVPLLSLFALLLADFYFAGFKRNICQIAVIFAGSGSLLLAWLFANLRYNKYSYFMSQINNALRHLAQVTIETLLRLAALPSEAYHSTIAIGKTLYRVFVSRKDLLEWQSSDFVRQFNKNGMMAFLLHFLPSVILGLYIFQHSASSVVMRALALLWLISAGLFYVLSNYNSDSFKLNKRHNDKFIEIGMRIWSFYEAFCNKENNFLPIDNFQEYNQDKQAQRTSPTNIGVYLLSIVAAHDLGWISLETAIGKIEKLFATLDKMKKYKGHFFNWYDTRSLEVLNPPTISTVDSGNLAGHLLALYGALISWQNKVSQQGLRDKLTNLANKSRSIAYAMDFGFLLNKERQLLCVSYDLQQQRQSKACYDMLASEARLGYFFAIAKGDIEAKIWQRLGRLLTNINSQAGLLSWSGSMFEYLMAPLILKEPTNSLLGQTNRLIIKKQIQYAKMHKLPWGISEAAYNAFDTEANYQYSNFGVADLGLQRNLRQNYVVAPYATLLASMFYPYKAIKNLKLLAEDYGAYGRYGFYDAIDFTASRLLDEGKGMDGASFVVTKNYYAHHHGMSLIAIYNLLSGDKIQDYFYNDPAMPAFEILLQEKAPIYVPKSNFNIINNSQASHAEYLNSNKRIIINRDNTVPQFTLLGNEDYSFILDNKANIYNLHSNIFLQPIFSCYNTRSKKSHYIIEDNCQTIFTDHSAIYSNDLHEIKLDIEFIATTSQPYNNYLKGYGVNLILSNENYISHQIRLDLQFSEQDIEIIENQLGFIVKASKANSKICGYYFLPAHHNWFFNKADSKLILHCDVKIEGRKEQNLYFWYFERHSSENIQPILQYLNYSTVFKIEESNAWLATRSYLFQNNIKASRLVNYQKLISLLLAEGNRKKILFKIDSRQYLNVLFDIMSFWNFCQTRLFHCELIIVNECQDDIDNASIEHEIYWLMQAYDVSKYENYFSYINNKGEIGSTKQNYNFKDYFIILANNGTILEQMGNFNFEGELDIDGL